MNQAAQYERDSRAYEIQNLASTLEFFAERGATWLDVRAITTLARPEVLEVRLAERVEPRATVLMVFAEGGTAEASQVYGKVDRIQQAGDDRIVVSIVLTTPLLDTERLLQGRNKRPSGVFCFNERRPICACLAW